MKTNLLTTAIGTFLIIIGTFLPWVDILGITANGWASGPGIPLFFIIFGGLALGLNFLGKKWSAIVSIILSVILILIALVLVSAFVERGESAAIGIWLIALGGIMNIVGSIMGLMKKKDTLTAS